MKDAFLFGLLIGAFLFLPIVFYVSHKATEVEVECLKAGWPDSRYFATGSYCLNSDRAVAFEQRWNREGR